MALRKAFEGGEAKMKAEIKLNKPCFMIRPVSNLIQQMGGEQVGSPHVKVLRLPNRKFGTKDAATVVTYLYDRGVIDESNLDSSQFLRDMVGYHGAKSLRELTEKWQDELAALD